MMNFILNTKFMKGIIAGIIIKNIKKNMKIDVEINVEELEIKSYDNKEYFNINIGGSIKDNDLIKILVENGIL